jgi:hypothetical protein
VLELFLSSSLSYFFLIFSALSGLVAVSVAPLVPGDLVLAASQNKPTSKFCNNCYMVLTFDTSMKPKKAEEAKKERE